MGPEKKINTRVLDKSHISLKEGGTQKNNFSKNLTVDSSGGFEPRVHSAEHQKRYRLRYATRKARRLYLPICAGPFFSLNTSLNTTRVPTSFNAINACISFCDIGEAQKSR